MFGFGVNRTPANPVALVQETAGAPAVNLAKVRDSGHINLAKAADKAGLALSKRDLAGIRAKVVCVLDHSGSMAADFRSRSVHRLVERVLGFALQIDVDGTVPVIPFDGRVWPTVNVTVDNYARAVDEQIWKPQQMGSTDLAAALEVVREMAAKTKVPMYVPIVTDGNPDRQGPTTDIVCDLARYPVFLKFAAIKPVSYLSQLDELGDNKRLLDNCNAQPQKGSNLDLLSCTEMEFAEAMADEWDLWVQRALKAGVLLSR